MTVFVSIRTNTHSIEWLKRFSEVVGEFPEVVEFYRMSGDVDYLLRVVVPDIAAYDAFYKRLITQDRNPRRVVGLCDGADQIYDAAAARLHGDRPGEVQRGLITRLRVASPAVSRRRCFRVRAPHPCRSIGRCGPAVRPGSVPVRALGHGSGGCVCRSGAVPS